MEFWRDVLNSPRLIVAPMVDASELAWRVLSRRHGAQLCYTPMLHSSNFVKDSKYRSESLGTCAEDKPLIVQFCGNDPDLLLQAGLLAQDHCCAVDINLGCPQAIAKRGHYGAFLQDDWPLLENIVSLLSKNLKVPVTCKIRIFPDVHKSVEYAQMLERAGCKMLTVHGRTRDQKGPLTGLADWSYVKKIREVLTIPIISNGNIQCLADVERCLELTGVQGVMSAEGNLYNPCIYRDHIPTAWDMALEYLQLVALYPCPMSYIRGHLFKLFHHLLVLPENNPIRIELGAANTIKQIEDICELIREQYIGYHEGNKPWSQTTIKGTTDLVLPPWLCQPYVRMAAEDHIKLLKENQTKALSETGPKRVYTDADGNRISRKSMKKLKRIHRRPEKGDRVDKKLLPKCDCCENPMGNKCEYKLCRTCCRKHCFANILDCIGHRVMFRTKRKATRT